MTDRQDDVGSDETEIQGLKASKRAGGGKLSRSETVTVRLDPKLNYLCELAARSQRRTKSSFVEWAIEHALKFVDVPGSSPKESFESQGPLLWDVNEADRLASLALNAPVLLNYDEQFLWKLVETNGLMWRGQYFKGKWTWGIGPTRFRWDVFREYYPIFKAVADGDSLISELPTWQEDEPADSEPEPFDPDNPPF